MLDLARIVFVALAFLFLDHATRAERVGDESAAIFEKPVDTEKSSVRLLPADEALQGMTMPDGFRATIFAAEPMVRQPIAITTDARGRLWVAENYTYAEEPLGFDTALRDRIVILEDTDGDGRADRRSIFWDGASKLTSVALGLGGVWALCPPDLLFLPDADGDDRPDGEPMVMLDGWDDDQVRHNVVNGLRWGPDGWLYGRHGILRTSHVGTPGTDVSERQRINCGIWRFHPVRHEFQVVAHGTTNSWGMDWDEHGQLFFINTVIGHLWHVIPGAHYERMYGEDFNPYLYQLIPQTADHYHWDTNEAWLDIRTLGVTPTTDEAGGGHAHSGLMIYLGDNWPQRYRGSVFTINFHGRRLNRDTLMRHEATYVATHAPDLINFADPWFRGIDLLYGRDGGVYIADWSDVGECHESDGVHRNSGRIFKITYGDPRIPSPPNIAALSNLELVQLQSHRNEWYARQARQVLYDRFVAGTEMDDVHDALAELYATLESVPLQLRAMWCLHAIGGASTDWLITQLGAPNEHLRVWAIKLLVEQGALLSHETALQMLLTLAEQDSSGLVLTFLASALQQMPLAERWPLADKLAGRAEFADDDVYPLMIWYGIEAAVPASPARAVALLRSARIPLLREHVARRLASDLKTNSAPMEEIAIDLKSMSDATWQRDVLEGVSLALRGWRRAEPPAHWISTLEHLQQSSDEQVAELARNLLVVFGDGRALDELRELVVAQDTPLEMRRSAIQSLVASRADGLAPMLQSLLEERDLAPDAIRGLAAFGHPDTPAYVLNYYDRLHGYARGQALDTLVSRPTYAKQLLAAIADGRIEREDVSPFQVRQMWSFGDEPIERQLRELWPELRHSSEDKAAKIAAYRELLSGSELAQADRTQGRALFQRHCASCHRLFGQGHQIGPDLTGAQRTNLTYLLENIVDPSLQLAENFRMSILLLDDGRVVNGVITEQAPQTITVQTATEPLVIDRDAIEEIVQSELSLMPERLLDQLTEQQIRDLFAYLMSPQQVPLPQTSE